MKHGSILIYSLLIMSVILAVSLSLNAAFLRNLGNIREAQDSVRALYAADAGVEYCLYESRTDKEAGGIFASPESRDVQGSSGPPSDVTGGFNQGGDTDSETYRTNSEEYIYTLPPDDADNRSAEFKVTNLAPGGAGGTLNPGDSINDCRSLFGDSAFDIRATGTFRSANRSLEISYE